MKVQIGKIAIGDGEKIAVQSMCNTKTTDIDDEKENEQK